MSAFRGNPEDVCLLCMTDAVEKVENRTTPKISQMLIFGLLRRCDALSVATKVHGRFSEKRCGPSRRCARNALAALENFVCCPQKTFSTASTHLRHHCPIDMPKVRP